MKKISVAGVLFILLFFNTNLISFAYNDYDGNGVISRDEKERWAQESGFNSHREMMDTMADPEKWAQFVQSHGGIEGNYGGSSSSNNTKKEEKHDHSYTATRLQKNPPVQRQERKLRSVRTAVTLLSP